MLFPPCKSSIASRFLSIPHPYASELTVLLHKKSCRRRCRDGPVTSIHYGSWKNVQQYSALSIFPIYITEFLLLCQVLFLYKTQMFFCKIQKHCHFQTVLLLSLKEKSQNSDILQKSARPDTGSSGTLHFWRYPKILSCRGTPDTTEAQAIQTQRNTILH